MEEILTTEQIKSIIREVLKQPEYLTGLSNYQKNKVLEFINTSLEEIKFSYNTIVNHKDEKGELKNPQLKSWDINNIHLGSIGFNYNQLETVKSLIKPEIKGNLKLNEIKTKGKPEEILNFWFKLLKENQKGVPYWENKSEIMHFVNQNFEGFPGVNEIKTHFQTNMNITQLYQVIWHFFNKFGNHGTKELYVKLLQDNFIELRNSKSIYSNIKDYQHGFLKILFK